MDNVPSPKIKTYGLETLETVSKATAVLLVGTYVLGFVIVSLHDASYGFFEVNPLRPRILAAGLLFLLMTALPASFVTRFYSHDVELSPQQQVSQVLVAMLSYYLVCV